MEVIKLSTTDLKNLNHLPPLFTRDVKTTHVNKLKSSIEKYGVVRDAVLAKLDFIPNSNGNLFIIDGHALIRACIELSKGIEAKVINVDGMKHLVELMSTVNSATKNWSVSNYLDAWSTIGVDNYVYLKRKRDELKLSTAALITIYAKDTSYETSSNIFKDGRLNIDKDRGDGVINAYRSYIDCGLYESANSLISVSRLMRKLNIQSFDDRLCDIIKQNLSVYSQYLTLSEYNFYFSIHTKNKF
jgi:hypothetical protein